MKKTQLWIIGINISTVVLIFTITLVPSSIARIILGMPFLIYFPGYLLVAALFPPVKANQGNPPGFTRGTPAVSGGEEEGRESRTNSLIDGIERVSLNFGMSIAVTSLIGLGLNYTTWGVRLEPILYAQAIVIFFLSFIAWIRAPRTVPSVPLKKGARLGIDRTDKLDRLLTAVLTLVIMGAVGMLIYTVAFPQEGEEFTEFYLLGRNGKADGYPEVFSVIDGNVVGVDYGNGQFETGEAGLIIVGIINHEQSESEYRLYLLENGKSVPLFVDGQKMDSLGPIRLLKNEKYEQELGFAPSQIGENLKIEFVLMMGNISYFDSPPHLWVDVVAGN